MNRQSLVLSSGSIIHYDLSRKIIGTDSCVLITCGVCKEQRFANSSNISHMRKGESTGYCRACGNSPAVREHPNHWQGGYTLTAGGYVHIHRKNLTLEDQSLFASMFNKHNYAPEHRIIFAKSINRPLRSDEVVHHLNGIKNDNRLVNLALVTPEDHPGENMVKYRNLQKEIRRLQSILEARNISS